MSMSHSIITNSQRKPFLILILILILIYIVGMLPLKGAVSVALAQNSLPTARAVGPGTDTSGEVASGDFDLDGDLDLIIGGQDASFVYLNDGKGMMRGAGEIGLSYDALLPADLDGDNDLDVIADDVVYVNNSLGAFTEAQTLSASAYAVGDLNGDGALDVVTGDGVYLNQGDGTLRIDTFHREILVEEPVALADFDSDGDLDVASVYDRTRVLVLINNGTGDFSQLPLIGGQWFITAIVAGDVDGDGDLDIITGNRLDADRNTIYLNEGGTKFEIERFFGDSGDNTTSLALGDVDGDGDLDIVAGNNENNGDGEQDYLYLNDGSGNYTERIAFGTGADSTLTVLLGDLDGDMSLELISGNYGQYTFVTSGLFPAPIPRVATFGASDLSRNTAAAGDLDSNGTVDLVLGTESEQLYIYLSDNAGRTVVERGVGATGGKIRSIALGDLDSDGDLDIATGSWGGLSLVYFNDGTANFTAQPTYASGDLIEQIRLGDIDGDGDLDIVSIPFSYQDFTCSCIVGGVATVYFNNGQGLFTTFAPFGTGFLLDRASLGDIDGDRDLDLVATQRFAGTVMFLNDGAGVLSAVVTLPDAGTSDVSLLDIDRDSDTDLLLVSRYDEHILAINRGGGAFDELRLLSGGQSRVEGVLSGDMNGDGFIDLVFYDFNSFSLFTNDGVGNFTETPSIWLGGSPVELVDYDRDGALDLLTLQNVHINDRTGKTVVALNYGPTADGSELYSGDLDNDGDIDLLAASSPSNKVYLNDGEGAYHIGTTTCGVTTEVLCVDAPLGILGDIDGDGDLDIVAPGTISFNDGTGQFPRSIVFAELNFRLEAVAVGDLDQDNDLDIVTAYSSRYDSTCNCLKDGVEAIHLNNGDGTLAAPRPLGIGGDETVSISLADLDADGDLDVIAGNEGHSSAVNRGLDAVYFNLGNATFGPAHLFGDPSGRTVALVPGDFDGDGDVDIAVGNEGQQNAVFLNDNAIFNVGLPFGRGNDATESMVSLDWDNDGDLDLAVDYSFAPTTLMINDGRGNLRLTRALQVAPSIEEMSGLAAGDFDRDGDTDLATARGYDNEVTASGAAGRLGSLYLNQLYGRASLSQNSPSVRISPPTGSLLAPGFTGGPLNTSQIISLTFQVADPEGESIRRVRASYSLDGGGSWINAVPVAGTALNNLDAPPSGATYIFPWDTFASGLFGQSDQVLFRIEAEPSVRPTRASVAGPYQRAFVASSTQSFRVRGTQVRVVDEAGQPVNGAVVYRLRAGQSRNAAPLSDSVGQPFRTDGQGFLAGRSALTVGQAGDQLVALRPVVITDTYTLYHTSAPVTERGLNLAQLANPGVQTLTISAERPLLLFNLDVALEWDARGDAQFMTRLHDDLRRTSEILYDWSNGQVALGEVNVFHDARRLRYDGGWDLWTFANVRVYASNRIRPNANKGGIVSEPTADPSVAGVEYEPGQIRMGAVWNRYGEAAGTLGEDWPRTLAHELGHYLFALDENYLGLNADGVLVPVEGCRGGMADPYRDDYSELHPRDEEWTSRCAGTLSQQVNGRSDWESMLAFYPRAGLRAPERFDDNRGPALLPLAVTTVTDAPVITPTQTLDVPLFNLEAEGERVQPGSEARAFLFRDDLAIDLGRPALDRVEARGATAGDRLCVFEPSVARLGCETVTVGDQTLDLAIHQDWRPEIVLTPVTSRTLTVAVTNLPGGLPLTARLYPADYPAGPAVPLSYADGAYRATFGPEVLAEPVFEGLVQIKVDDGSDREAVVDFALGGNPGKRWARTAPRGNPGKRWARTAPRGNPGKRWARTAPVISSDGQVILFTDQEFNEGEFYSFQTVNVLPDAPTWVNTVGQAYRLTGTANAPALARASISFSYLQREVPAGQERWLNIYYYNGVTWEKLPQSLSAETNTVSAPIRGPGVYALMTSIEVALRNSGWNYVRYPIAENRPAGDALAGLAGQLQSGEQLIVYADNGPEAPQRWRLYATGVPDYVNSLSQLEVDHDYYIWVPRAMTLPIRGAALASVVAQPPATFYGVIGGVEGLNLTSDLPITARIGTTACGHGTIKLVGNQYMYVVSVEAESTRLGCGAPGRQVSFQVDAQTLGGVGFWDDSRVQALHLYAAAINRDQRLYLPLVQRR